MLYEPMFEAVLRVPHARKHDEGKERGKDGDRVHAEAYCHADGRSNPETGRCGDAVKRIAAENNEPTAEKTDTRDNTGGKKRRLYIRDTENAIFT